MNEYRQRALDYVSDYRKLVQSKQFNPMYNERVEQLLLALSEEDLAVLEELLIFAGER